MNFDCASWRQMWRPSNDERKRKILSGGERPVDAVTLVYGFRSAKISEDALSYPRDRSQRIMAKAGSRDARLVSSVSERDAHALDQTTLLLCFFSSRPHVGFMPPLRSSHNTTNTATYASFLSNSLLTKLHHASTHLPLRPQFRSVRATRHTDLRAYKKRQTTKILRDMRERYRGHQRQRCQR